MVKQFGQKWSNIVKQNKATLGHRKKGSAEKHYRLMKKTNSTLFKKLTNE